MSAADAQGAIYEVLDELRASSQTEVEKGQRFERLIKQFLIKEPTFEDRFEWVKLWDDWEDRTDSDTGIDLVALDKRTQKVCAIQCKFYAEEAMLSKKQVDSFLATVGQGRFGSHILVHTAGGLANHLIKTLDQYDPRVIVLDVDDLAKAQVVSWPSLKQPAEKLENTAVRYELRPHQQEAVQRVTEAFDGAHKGIGDLPAGVPADRGKMIMACGSGKTYTALKIAEQIVGAGGNVLYLVPSISLLSQSLKEWAEQRSLPHNYVGVCSDTTAGKDSEDERVEGLTIPVSTSPKNIAAAFGAARPGDLTICFSTYQSIEKVMEAQRAGAAPEFDLIFADEAHRTTGLENENAKSEDKVSPFIRVHDDYYIKGRRRLYLSATPRIYASGLKAKAGDSGYRIFSMDDADAYGEELYRLSFGEAVDKGILSDYRVAIIWVDEDKTTETASIEKILSEQIKGGQLDVEAAAKMTGLIKLLADPSTLEGETEGQRDAAAERQSLSRAIVFANSIAFSKAIVESLPKVHSSLQEDAPEGDPLQRLKVEPRHTDGKSKAKMRQRDLAWLNVKKPRTAKILSNARCLAEGVDIPALDAAIFMSPRNSYIDIIQAVGRVMRKAPGKEYGYILIPAIIPKPPEGVEPQEYIRKQLDTNKTYQTIWRVLQALRSHDERFEVEIEQLRAMGTQSDRIKSVVAQDREPVVEISGVDDELLTTSHDQLSFDLSQRDFLSAINAKIVEKVGDRHYWTNWSTEIKRHIEAIEKLINQEIRDYPLVAEASGEWLSAMREALNENVSAGDLIEMLAQHIVSRPIFEALFRGDDYLLSNPMAKAMDTMLSVLDAGGLTDLRKEQDKKLARFYESARHRIEAVSETGETRLAAMLDLYESFFKVAMPEEVKKFGVAYTPTELVDFLIRSTDQICRTEFGKGLTSKGIDIIEPFAGTGTFINRLLTIREDATDKNSPYIIRDEDLVTKYENEIHANEIMLLAYHLATLKTEEGFYERVGWHQDFEGIVLTDTFTMEANLIPPQRPLVPNFGEGHQRNNARKTRQEAKTMRVVVSNPPWSAGQKNANDANPNERHTSLEKRIQETYSAKSRASNKVALQNLYFKALRWASDRVLHEAGGVIAMVLPNSLIDGKSEAGFRKQIAEEFDVAYAFNLLGKQSAAVPVPRQKIEGKGVFVGISQGVCILLLVAYPKPRRLQEGFRLFYREMNGRLTREEKLVEVAAAISVSKTWQRIEPDEHGDWLNQRIEYPNNAIPITLKGSKKNSQGVFNLDSVGLKSNRDPICFGSNKEIVRQRAIEAVEIFNRQVAAGGHPPSQEDIKKEVAKFKWHDTAKLKAKTFARNKERLDYNPESIIRCDYRPFFPQWCDFNSILNSRHYQLAKLFPNPNTTAENLAVAIDEQNEIPSALATRSINDLGSPPPHAKIFARFTHKQLHNHNGREWTGEWRLRNG